ncbi:hypothetical protein D9611_014964, partial [Ephemerocybe angulata]
MPTEHISQSDADQLNNYNVAQLEYGLHKDELAYLQHPVHYTDRRMSSSNASTADTDSSTVSRPEKRPPTRTTTRCPAKAALGRRHRRRRGPPRRQGLAALDLDVLRQPPRLAAGEPQRRAPCAVPADEPAPVVCPEQPQQLHLPARRRGPVRRARRRRPAPPLDGRRLRAVSCRLAVPPVWAVQRALAVLRVRQLEPLPQRHRAAQLHPRPAAQSPDEYDDAMRHASFSGPVSQQQQQQQLFQGLCPHLGPAARAQAGAAIKSEWQFTNNDFVLPPQNGSHYSPPMAPAPPSLNGNGTSPGRSPPASAPSRPSSIAPSASAASCPR